MTNQNNNPAGGPKKNLLGKLLGFAWKNKEVIYNIVDGWLRAKKVKKSSKAVRDMSTNRLMICDKCPMSKHSYLLEIVNGKAKEVYTRICEGCKCPLLQKSLVKSEKCPLDKWPIV